MSLLKRGVALESFIRSAFRFPTYGSTFSRKWLRGASTQLGTKVYFVPNLGLNPVPAFISTARIPSTTFCRFTDGVLVGLSNPSPGVIDYGDWRSLQAIYDAAKLAGIFVVLRPGERFYFFYPCSPFLHRFVGPYVSRYVGFEVPFSQYFETDQRRNDVGRHLSLDNESDLGNCQNKRF